MVAALAKALQIPVIVAAESYKFSEKVQLDSIVYNELGHASEIAVIGTAAGAGEAVKDCSVVCHLPFVLTATASFPSLQMTTALVLHWAPCLRDSPATEAPPPLRPRKVRVTCL